MKKRGTVRITETPRRIPPVFYHFREGMIRLENRKTIHAASVALRRRGFASTRLLRRDIGAWLLLLPCVICFLVTIWQPLVSGLILSFFRTVGYDAVQFIGLDNYRAVITNSEFKAALVNTFSYTFWSLIIGFLLPIIVALMLNEIVHINAFFKFSLYFPSMVPAVAASLLWYFMFYPGQGGILNGLLSAIHLPTSQWLQNPHLTILLIVCTMTWRGFGGTMLIYLASLQGINRELYEAASLDGANYWQKQIHITLPSIANIVMLMLIMQIIGIFQVMNEPMVMTEGGPNNASLSLMLESYNYGFRYFQAGRSMAVGAITFVILAVLTVIYQALDKKFSADE